jgi:3-oxoadipate enol-lactonase
VDHHFWMPAAASLDSAYRVLLPDLPGHGRSTLGEEPTSMASMARALLQLLDALSIEQAIFAGCSIGGYLLYELWRQAPQRARALAICCAKPHADTPEAARNRERTIATIEERGTGLVFEAMLKSLVGAPARDGQPEILDRLRSMAERMAPASAIAVQRALASRPDSRATASTICVPTTVLAGALDEGSTPREMRELAKLIAGASFHLLQDLGHYAPYEQPRSVGALLRHFFDSLHD